ncbi:YdhK family protein [Ectobacillus ponti]|uniref:YdhK family protein n=1 Tax=Ectobacillus ponti TaxID=2961894 RepID=A0AA42BPL7_9BACI|nr:YdhK family protein [Ectobacillus ponti]MCP8969265.1 YdhK family protein [Ectobacillus ponti]
MKKQLFILGTIAAIALSGCSTNTKDTNNSSMGNMGSMNHEGMHHSGSGQVPQGLQTAANPKYKVGSQATIKADHMAGMNGAKATIVGAYDTTVYAVSYTPTTGGEKVKNHKWIVQEELEHAGDQPLKPGTEVTLKADHMEGMNGAKATIDSAEKATVYMVDYTATDGQKVKNHQWVTESELVK